jgi:hypothetical protein
MKININIEDTIKDTESNLPTLLDSLFNPNDVVFKIGDFEEHLTLISESISYPKYGEISLSLSFLKKK